MKLIYPDDFINRAICIDCRGGLKLLPDNSISACITDPPYELGFMGKAWDKKGVAYDVDMWREVLRVLKPGGHLLSFGGSRTYHRMACAIEDAGFEIRDMIEWVYGSGFPKSLNISKAIDKKAGGKRKVVGVNPNYCENRVDSIGTANGIYGGAGPDKGKYITAPLTSEAQRWSGWGTALKPAHEPICMARKPLSEKTVAENVLKYGTGGINVDGCRVETTGDELPELNRVSKRPADKASGFMTSTKHTFIPSQGRFPANLIHDGSDEVLAEFPSTETHEGICHKYSGTSMFGLGGVGRSHANSGSAARFFYCAKASKTERDMGCGGGEEKQRDEGRKKGNPGGDNPRNCGLNKRTNYHPTVKPLALMRYLCRLVTPPGGVVIDPFAGSGSTLIAAAQEGFQFIGFDDVPAYVEITEKRLNAVPKTLFNPVLVGEYGTR